MAKKHLKIFATRYFGLVIGLLVFLLLTLFMEGTILIDNIELNVLDLNFRLKNIGRRTRVQEGVTLEKRSLNISPDILIVGIDDRSLDKFGRWPFPRYTEANLINSFSRIKNQEERERALFMDIFFVEPSNTAEDDALLVESIEQSGRVYLETILTRSENPPGTEEEYFGRQEIMYQHFGKITNIKGDWTKIETFHGMFPPLKPYARATRGYGHPNFVEDNDEVYRKQPLVVKSAVFIEEFRLDHLTTDDLTEEEYLNFTRLAWMDMDNILHDVPFPLTDKVLADLAKKMEKSAPFKAVDTDNDKKPDLYYHVVKKYKDNFLPSITLSLALDYFNKKLSDIEVVLGEYILIPDPYKFNLKTQKWEPYVLERKDGKIADINEIKIPINERGQMLINFMGIGSSPSPQGHQTFPVRSFYGYAARVAGPDPEHWPRTKAVGNKILMVGPFSKGIAEDEKTTPYGLMYGVEIHANALNTILMNNFLYYLPRWANILVLLAITMLTAFMVSRLSTIWSLIISMIMVVVFFFSVSLIFDIYNTIMTLSAPILGILLAFLSVIVYRIMTEEKDKARIRDMFGKYVSPRVVDQILANPPELGGVDKDLTVFFSDIRGFTTFSEAMTPQELVNHLNQYLTAMTDIILDHQGTLDKYVGDEIMCFWGAPLPQEEHAILACQCALQQMETLHKMNDNWPPEKKINIGIGINSGIMTVGNMGSMGRMNYTLMGDNVNLGARLEGTNKQYLTNIIISEYTYGLVKDRIIARELDNIRVKGKNKPVLIYELNDVTHGYEPAATAQTKGKGRG
ncbi:MAG TPA: CHASE2 domain-containing protein [Spirochaetales bacterium]|nr:CHASE2 domain-containing protein [Spirochaetales bacterium]